MFRKRKLFFFFFFAVCLLFFLLESDNSKCSGVSVFVEFWIESLVLVHCYSKVFTQKTV